MLGQRGRRVVLRNHQNRTHRPPRLAHPNRRTQGDLRIHRRLVQHPPTPLQSRLPQPQHLRIDPPHHRRPNPPSSSLTPPHRPCPSKRVNPTPAHQPPLRPPLETPRRT